MKEIYIHIIMVIILFILLIWMFITIFVPYYCDKCEEVKCECPPCDNDDTQPCPTQPTCVKDCTECNLEDCSPIFRSLSLQGKILLFAGGYLNVNAQNQIYIEKDVNKADIWQYQNKKLFNSSKKLYLRWIGFPPNNPNWNFYFQLLSNSSPAGSIEDEYLFDGYNFFVNYYTENTYYMLTYFNNTFIVNNKSDNIIYLNLVAVPAAAVGRNKISIFKLQ